MIRLSDHLHIPTMREVIGDRTAAKKPAVKRFAAANANRFNQGWTTSPETANFALSQGVRILRARARQMCGDVPAFKKFLTKARANIVGPNGLQLQCRARKADGKLNARLNKRVENAFFEWTYRETCTVSGKMDWLQAQRLFVTQIARDGEVLVQKVKVRTKDNAFGFALKFIDVSYLDEGYNETRPNGNRVIMSVEVDADNRPVAYWLTTPSTDWMFEDRNRRYERTRVPAGEMIHAFLINDDESQVRGVTWFHAVLLQGKSLASYVDGVVTQARVAAMSLGFITEEFPDETGGYDGKESDEGCERDVNLNIVPAGFTMLNPGQKVEQWDPKQPTQNHAQFKRSMEADVATGLDLPYFDLYGDMEAVNYSSARVGLGEARDVWRDLQDFVGTAFCREVYHAWLEAAVLSGKLSVSAAEYAQVQNPYWRGRGWPYIDPTKEINANVAALENKLTTWTEVLADRGIDLVDHLETLRSEQELAAEMGVELTVAKAAETPANNDILDESLVEN